MRSFFSRFLLLALLLLAAGPIGAEEPVSVTSDKESLVTFPGPWAFQLGKACIILVSDQELEILAADPDKAINMAVTFDKVEKSLRQVCEEAKAGGVRTLILAYDHFFTQYRPGQNKPRALTPDMDEYVQRIAAISHFAQQYGLGLELSLLSPLEIGPAYRARTGESGVWMHYRKGRRDPGTGGYSVQLWQQMQWGNNKGIVKLEDAGVRVFAYDEERVVDSTQIAVNPASIVEITDTAQVERFEETNKHTAQRIRVWGVGRTDIGTQSRVLVVQQYRTPEMDYFSDKALPFLKDLIDKYAAAGVKLNGLYSDEMHIQQDWNYFGHHDNGEFALRYVSPGFARAYAERYGEQYADFAKYLVYFVHGQEDSAQDVLAKEGFSTAFGESPRAVRETALFRARYYHLLQDGVVDLFTAAKRYAEEKMGQLLEARAHATWAESPTIDRWNTGQENHQRNQYEYTSNFVWSCTVQQASAACYDYFKWGDFLTGNGNDHAEGGWLDRDYYALALGCSTGILNDVPYSYAAHWGMPDELSQRRMSLVNVYGTSASPLYGLVENMQHRDVEVMMLYPLDLVATEERFGSWMTQYGYANYISQAKLLERGQVSDGVLTVAGRKFTTLVALFEPFPHKALLERMRELAESGGRVIWAGPPPVITAEGDDALPIWQDLVGVEYEPAVDEGIPAPGRQVVFEGKLSAIQPQIILSDLLVDRIYPVKPCEGVTPVARVKKDIVGVHRTLGKGTVTFLGYRPRDDQAASLGYETRNWFEILNTLGAYPSSGRFEVINDNTEYVSRTTPWLACRFPNGTIAIAPHFKDLEEGGWDGGFARNMERDKQYLSECPPPSDVLQLNGLRVNGHVVSYEGIQALAFRVNGQGNLIAFAGNGANRISIDGHETIFADAPLGPVCWAPVSEDRRTPDGAILQIRVIGNGTLRIPAAGLPEQVVVYAEGSIPGSKGSLVSATRDQETLNIPLTPEIQNRWMYVTVH